MTALPFGGERGEAVRAVGAERRGELGREARKQAIAVDRRRAAAGDGGEIADRLRDVALERLRQADVEPDADDDGRRARARRR